MTAPTALFTFIDELLDVPLIRARQNVSQITPPFAVYFVVTRGQKDHAEPQDVNEAGFRDSHLQVNLRVQVDIYGADAFDKAQVAAAKLTHETIIDRAASVGININNVYTAQDMSAELPGTKQYRERGSFEFTYLTVDVQEEEPQWIDGLTITGDISPNLAFPAGGRPVTVDISPPRK